jgi:hypothetical protein
MSGLISITDHVKVMELVEQVQRGESLCAEEVNLLAEYLDRYELDILEALRPGKRL